MSIERFYLTWLPIGCIGDESAVSSLNFLRGQHKWERSEDGGYEDKFSTCVVDWENHKSEIDFVNTVVERALQLGAAKITLIDSPTRDDKGRLEIRLRASKPAHVFEARQVGLASCLFQGSQKIAEFASHVTLQDAKDITRVLNVRYERT